MKPINELDDPQMKTYNFYPMKFTITDKNISYIMRRIFLKKMEDDNDLQVDGNLSS